MQTHRCIALSVLAIAAAPAPAAGTTEPALVKAVNAERAERHLPALKRSPSLRRSARRYARWMTRRDVFGHQARIHASHRFARLGENLALSFGRDPAARRVVGLWLGSRSHRRLLLARRMHWIGAGKSRGSFRGRRATIWALHLGVLR